MEFIGKNHSNHQAESHRIIDEYLHEVQADKDLYNRFSDPLSGGAVPKRQMFPLLLQEQSRCCYCMRRLKDSPIHTSIEHVIPQHVSKEDYERYFTYGAEIDRGMIMHEEDYVHGNRQTPPYPHTVAYENFVLSCDGIYPNSTSVQSCNSKRGDEFIPPVSFIRDIHEKLQYLKNGNVRYTGREDGEIPMVTIIGIDAPILKAIRMIWAYLDEHGENVANCNRNVIIDTLWTDMMSTLTREEEEALNLFREKEYWDLLGAYDYFSNLDVFTN